MAIRATSRPSAFARLRAHAPTQQPTTCDFTSGGYCCNKASDGNYHCINPQGYVKILPPPPAPPK